MRLMTTILLSTLLLLGQTPAKDSEEKVKMQDLPPAVQQAVKEHSKGARLHGLSKEVENGKTLYEAEYLVGGRTKDVTFDASGKVVTVEEQVTLSTIPASARQAIQKAVGTGKVTLVEAVTEEGGTFYEAHIQKLGKASEFKVDAAGKPVK